MDNIDKLRLIKIDIDGPEKKVAYASYLKKDYVAKSLVMYFDESYIITKIFLNSDIYGSVEWINGSGFTNCHRWESEDEAKSQSYLTRRYTAILSDGAADIDYANNFIIPDIMDNFNNPATAQWLRSIILAKNYPNPLDLNQFVISQ